MAQRARVDPEYEEFVFGSKRKGSFAWADIRPVLSAKRLQDKAFHRAAQITIPDRDKFYQRKKTAMARIDSVADTSVQTLMAYVEAFPDFPGLHPFYGELVSTIIDVDRTRTDLARLQGTSARIQEVCRKGVRQIQRTGKLDFLEVKRREVYGRVGSMIQEIRGPLKRLEEARRLLAKIPTLDPAAPTLIIAGVPNVGKSALATRICTAKPQVAPYPFTTQGIILGHTQLARRTVQVVDTPGILDRPADQRNEIEQRALAAVRHLGDVVLFLFDPTEGASQPMEAQEHLLEEVRTIFGKKLVVEAENKADVMKMETPRLKLSAKTGDGVEPLVKHLTSLMPDRSGRPAWAREEE